MRPRLASVVAAAAFAFGLGVALPTWSQDATFRPGANPISNQGYNSVAITPSDTTQIGPTRALFMGAAAACTITIVPNGSSTAVAFANVQPGEILPVQASLVKNTGTTCTGIVAIY